MVSVIIICLEFCTKFSRLGADIHYIYILFSKTLLIHHCTHNGMCVSMVTCNVGTLWTQFGLIATAVKTKTLMLTCSKSERTA